MWRGCCRRNVRFPLQICSKYHFAAGTDMSKTHLNLAVQEIVVMIPKNDFQCLTVAVLDVGWLW